MSVYLTITVILLILLRIPVFVVMVLTAIYGINKKNLKAYKINTGEMK